MKRLIFITLVFELILVDSVAQQSFNSGGDNQKEETLSISYSIGQLFSEPFSTYGGLVKTTPGIQQAFSVTVESSTQNSSFKFATILLYPNPAIHYLELAITDLELTQTKAILYDCFGKTIANYPIKTPITQIDVSHLISGVYLFKVVQGNEEIKLFKVIKK
ncbi:MAG: T9SS type A sorting domain-containing protein [Paludibacteraceae bacterium]|nr:T9SS type A sorting domain-containing protein [Paludibacteraceae bacterium]